MENKNKTNRSHSNESKDLANLIVNSKDLTHNKLKAISLLYVQKGMLNEVIKVLKKIPFVTKITSVTGDADIITHIEVDASEQFHDIFANIIDKTPGVIQTKTYIVMREFLLR